MNTQQHHHEWTETTTLQDPHRTWACTDCIATAVDCSTCGRLIETTGRTCDECISKARNTLREIRDLYRTLPDIIAAAAGLHAIRYDQRGTGKTRATDTTIIGGAAFVMATPGGRATWPGRGETSVDPALLDAERHDPPSVLVVLTDWEDAWRTEQSQHAAERTSVDAAVDYLLLHTTWAAQHAGDWAGYVRALDALRGRLRAVTGTSQPPVATGVPCPYCSGRVQQHWTTKGLGDIRECDGCGLTWETEARFMLAIREAHESLPETHPEQLVTLDDARRILKPRGVRPNLLALWAWRDSRDEAAHEKAVAEGRQSAPPVLRLPAQQGQDVRGQALYRLGDLVERIEIRTEAAS